MWGQVFPEYELTQKMRIIPMRVGTRNDVAIKYCFIKDHPHACGDKTWTANTIFGIVGSSPCVWGQEIDSTNSAKFNRIIPMRVGTSPRLHHGQCALQDHPHACGDKPVKILFCYLTVGSSPCVWGQD